MSKNVKERKRTITRKKLKIQRDVYVTDKLTGETEKTQVIEIEERDANFHKIWLNHIIMSLDLIGNQKTRLALWLTENMEFNNMIIMTYEKMAKGSGISIETVKITIPLLIEGGFLIRIHAGAYQINPDVIFKGEGDTRMNILLKYNKSAAENEKT